MSRLTRNKVPLLLGLTLLGFILGQSGNARGQNKVIAVPQNPGDLCQCSGDDSTTRGGIRTFEEFNSKFGREYPTRAELNLAWQVYKAVNHCNAKVVLGRLSDTDQFERQPGYCVLRNLVGWTMRVNQAFVQAATDRGAEIELVSDMPPETMGGNINPNSVGLNDREHNWIVIYNNEIKWVMRTGHYQLDYDRRKKITRQNPAYLRPGANTMTTRQGNSSAGTLELVEVTPDPKCSTWDIYPTCDPNGSIVAKANWGTVYYRWTPPPRRIDSNGVTVSLTAAEQTPPNAPIATGLNISGIGFDISPRGATLPIGAPKQPQSGNLSVIVKPPKSPSGDYYLKIGVYWGPGFTYHYRVVK